MSGTFEVGFNRFVQVGIIIISMIFSVWVGAQANNSIRTGRPGQAIGPYVVGTGFFQVQSGLDLSTSKGKLEQESQTLNNVIRYGFTESFEFSAVIDYSKIDLNLQSNKNLEGISNLQLGFRFNIIDKPTGIVPAIGIQTRFRLTSVGSDFSISHTAPIITLATGHKLFEYIGWANNFSISYTGNDLIPKHGYVTNLSFPILGSWAGFFEIYGHEQSGVNSIYTDVGISYLCNNNLQLDLSGGLGKNHGTEETIFSIGLSWRTQLLNGTLFARN